MRMAAATLAAPAAGSSSLRLDNRGPSSLNLGELWAHRELLYFLAWRDIKVRYKQTVLGLAWAVLQPLAMMLLFSFFFGRLAHVPSDGVPYPAFAYSGLALWLYFAAAVGRGSNCLIENSPLLTKVYFPRLLVPAASVLFGLPDLAMASILALALLAFFGIGPTAALLLVIPFALLATVVAFGVSVWLAALNVRYRDVRYVVPVLIQLWMFVSPVAYSSSLVPARWQFVYGLNPMAGAVDGFRWAVLGGAPTSLSLIAASAIMAVAVLASGVWFFARVEGTFGDVI
jgi:homopolymeric O-antigen transport system permease protein